MGPVSQRSWHCADAASRSFSCLSQSRTRTGPEIVYVGQCGAGHNEIAESGEEAISVISRERLLRRDASRGGTCQTVRVDNRSGIVFCSIDTIGVAGERPDALGAIERYGEREQELVLRPPRPPPVTVTVVSPPTEITAGGETRCPPTLNFPART